MSYDLNKQFARFRQKNDEGILDFWARLEALIAKLFSGIADSIQENGGVVSPLFKVDPDNPVKTTEHKDNPFTDSAVVDAYWEEDANQSVRIGATPFGL